MNKISIYLMCSLVLHIRQQLFSSPHVSRVDFIMIPRLEFLEFLVVVLRMILDWV